jgi:Flp pilus assembly protein TadD
MDEGAYEVAARHYREALESAPNDVELWVRLAGAESRADRPHRAREAWEHVAALRPTDPIPRLRIGFTWELERRYDEAAVAYRQACEIAPDDARPFRVLGTRVLRWGEPAAAIEPLERAVALAPDHGETWNALGLARYHTGDTAGAERAFRDGIARHPDHRGLALGLAALLVNAHRFEEALAVYDGVIGRWSDFAAAHVGRALLLHELGRREEAEAAFAKAVEVARDPRPYRARLRAYRALLARNPD